MTTPSASYPLDAFLPAPLREALAALRAGLARDDPLLLVTGNAGTGKTTVGRRLLEELGPERYALGGVFGSGGKGEAFLSQVVQDFGVRPPRPGDTFLTLDSFLQRWRTGGRKAVLVIDEAQAFDEFALRRLWQLAAAPAAGNLHVVLLAQKEPVAVTELARHGHLLQFGTRWQLRPLQESETREFVLNRLRTTGSGKGQPAFGPDALMQIHERSGGVLRQVCLLCDRIRMWVDMEDVHLVSAQVVDSVDDLLRGEWNGPRPEAPARTIESPATYCTSTGLVSAAVPVLTLEVPPGAHLATDHTDDRLAAAPAAVAEFAPLRESSQAPVSMALRPITAEPATAPTYMSAVPAAIAWETAPHVDRAQRLAPKVLAVLLLLIFSAFLGLGIQSFLRGSTLPRDSAVSSSSIQAPRETPARDEGRQPALVPLAEPVAAQPTSATPSPPAVSPALSSRAPSTQRPPPAPRRLLPTTAASTPVPCSGPAETMGLCGAQPRVSAPPATATPIPSRPAPPPCSAERAALGLCDVS